MRSLPLTVVIVVTALTNVTAAQPAGFLGRLVGVWRLSGIDRPEYEDHLYTLELEFTSRSEYRLYYRVDLEDPIVCEGIFQVDADSWIYFDTDPARTCDIFESAWNGFFFPDYSLLYDGSFRGVLTGRSLELRRRSSRDDAQVLRFERGRVSRAIAPPRQPCEFSFNTSPIEEDGALPPPARRNGPSFFPFDWHLEVGGWAEMLTSSARMGMEGARRRWLRRAVDAFEGRAAPVLLKFSVPTVHGDLIERFLDVRKDRAELTILRVDLGERVLIRCSISEMVAVEPLDDSRLIPMRSGRSAARARLMLRLTAEDSQQVRILFP